MAPRPPLAQNKGMSAKPDTPQDLDPPREQPPDGRGPRPTDPNELAKWIVEQTTRKRDHGEPSEKTNNAGDED